jgi:3-methyladenine DNA glycosylase Tag
MKHRAPWECASAREKRSECLPGIPPKSDQKYFEILSLCVLQAGLSWRMVRERWPSYRYGFFDFKFNRLAAIRLRDLMESQDVVRDRRKVQAIVHNAREFQRITEKEGSFSDFLESLKTLDDEKAVEILTKRFRLPGEPAARYYLHSVGHWK